MAILRGGIGSRGYDDLVAIDSGVYCGLDSCMVSRNVDGVCTGYRREHEADNGGVHCECSL